MANPRPATSAAPLPGPEASGGLDALLPEYEVVRELGRGGVSIVYLARDRELGREVAVKVIREQYVEDEEALARFAREARTVARLQHPNIVAVHGARRLGAQRLALIMQHVTGPTLRQVIRETGPLPFATVEQVLADIARALAHAHRFHVVHRDIKPENIYLDREAPRALLSDFGIAKPLDADSAVTLHGVVLGTPAYMAPEQVDGGQVDARSDIYSLGLVGHEMLTGRRPWEGESIYNVLYKQKHEALPPLSAARSDVPAQLGMVVERALRKDPAERWQSMDELLVALLGDRATRPLDGVAPAPPPAPRVPVPALAGDVHTIRFRRGETPGRPAATGATPAPRPATPTPPSPAAAPPPSPAPVVVVARAAAPPAAPPALATPAPAAAAPDADIARVLAEADAAAARDARRARELPLRYAALALLLALLAAAALWQLPRLRAAGVFGAGDTPAAPPAVALLQPPAAQTPPAEPSPPASADAASAEDPGTLGSAPGAESADAAEPRGPTAVDPPPAAPPARTASARPPAAAARPEPARRPATRAASTVPAPRAARPEDAPPEEVAPEIAAPGPTISGGGTAQTVAPRLAADRVPLAGAPPAGQVAPRLTNAGSVRGAAHALHRGRGAGAVEGSAQLWVWVDADGRPTQSRLHATSGSPEFDAAAREVVPRMRFVPATRGGEPVAAWAYVVIAAPGR